MRLRGDLHGNWARALIFGLLCLAAAAAAYGRTLLTPFQMALGDDLDLTYNQIAILQGPALAWSALLVAVPVGIAIDRFSRPLLLMFFIFLIAAGNALTTVLDGYAEILLARTLVGIGVPAITTIVFAEIVKLYDPATRGRATTVVVISQYLGMSAAFGLAGLFTATIDNVAPWKDTLIILCVPLIVVAFTLLWTSSLPMPEQVDKVRTASSLKQVYDLRGLLLPVILGVVLAEIALFGSLTWAIPALRNAFQTSNSLASSVVSVATMISGIVGPLIGGALADFAHKKGSVRATLRYMSFAAVLAAAASLYPVAPTLPVAIVVMTIFLTLAGALLVMAVTLLTVVVPQSVLGLTLSISNGVQMLLGVALAPVIVSVVASWLGGGEYIGVSLTLVGLGSGSFAAALFAYVAISGQFGRRSLDEPDLRPDNRISRVLE